MTIEGEYMNILIYLIMFITCIACIYISKKILGNFGLIITFLGMNILSFILSFKYVTISTINLNANCISYVTMFTALYLLLENMEKKQVKKIANMNFLVNIFITIMLFMMSYHTQSLTDTISINMKNVFITNYRVLLTYPITILLSNYILVHTYEKIKSLYDNMFISTVTTYLLVGIIEAILYFLLSYFNLLSIKNIIKLVLSTYMIRLVITVIYSLFLIKMTEKKVKK